jgi:1-acyl-sn-glycerol-3-phosphate acyltransferase
MRLGVRSLAFLTGTRIRTRDIKNLDKLKGACIFVANHASYLDVYVMAGIINRPFSFVAKSELAARTVVSVLLKRIGTIFVDRFDRQQGAEDTKTIIETGLADRSLFFFPEGTFMRMPGLLPFKMGAFETAARTDLPIVPIAIRGTRSILRADSWFPRHGEISVTFGKPLTAAGARSEDSDSWKTALYFRDQTRQWLLKHCGEPDLGHERPKLQQAAETVLRS